MLLTNSIIGATLGLWTLAANAAVVPQAFDRRQSSQVNCTDITHTIDSSCWATLGLTDYVTKWAENNSCPGQSFGRCFLSMNGLAGVNCDVIQNDACTPPSGDHFLSQPSNQAENFYVAYTIYALNQAFNTYYNGLSGASSLASDSVGEIVQLFDPPMDTNGLLNDILTALSVGLSFVGVGAPEVSALEKAVANALVVGAGTAISVGQYLFPRGTIDSQVQQFAQLSDALGGTIQTMLSNIEQAATMSVANSTNFLAFASNGTFSQVPNTSLFNQSSSLLKGLNTYVISQAMQANKIVIGQASNVNINDLAQQGKIAKSFKISCGSGYDSFGICDAYYFDAAHGTTYSLVDTALQSKNYHDIMETIFSKYTTPELLFVGGANCAAIGNSAHPGNLISLNATGLSANCLSNAPVCQWNQNDKTKAFTNCNDPQNWGALCQPGAGGSIVPAGYVGPKFMASNGLLGACR